MYPQINHSSDTMSIKRKKQDAELETVVVFLRPHDPVLS